MSDKTLRAINKGRRKAGLKPIRRKKTSSSKIPKGAKVAPTVVHNFIDNKPYGAGRTRAQTEKINRQNEALGYYPHNQTKKEISDDKLDAINYREYKKLGGKKSLQQYLKNQQIFIDETFDIFINGDPKKYSSRNKALAGVSKKAKIPIKEVMIIHGSIDNIHAYT